MGIFVDSLLWVMQDFYHQQQQQPLFLLSSLNNQTQNTKDHKGANTALCAGSCSDTNTLRNSVKCKTLPPCKTEKPYELNETPKRALLGGSWVVIIGVMRVLSPLNMEKNSYPHLQPH